MTHTRSWLALGALLAAIIGGTVWAQQQKAATVYPQSSIAVNATEKTCCDEQCCTKEEAKTCCEGKCCTAEKGKGCCSDGKCCGCCEKAKDAHAITLPVPPGAAVQVTVEPAGAGPTYDMPLAPPMPPYVSAPCPLQPACGPSWCPVNPTAPQPTPTLQYTPVTQYVATPCVAPPPPMPASPAPAPWLLRVVEVNHQPRLMMQFDGDKDTPRVSCEEMVVHMGPEPLKVSIADKQVHVSGNFITGSADTIGRNAANGNLVLEGHVKMHYGKEGNKVEVAAEEVVVNMSEGRVEVRGLGRAACQQPLTGEIQPTPTVPTSCPAYPASQDEAHHLFNFWMGLLR